MNRAPFLLLPAALLVTTALAQDATGTRVDLSVPATQNQPLRFAITAAVQSTDTRKMLVNGEEGGFGGAGGRGGQGGQAGRGAGGGGEVKLSQEVVFDQGPSDANWRHYRKLTATESRGGADGEGRENKLQGALEGRKVFLADGKDGTTTFQEGEGDQQKALAEPLARGLPGRLSLAGLLPQKEVGVGEEFDLSGTDFTAALRGLVHPVTPERPADAGAGPGRGGQGGQGGEGGQGGRPGRGGQGAGGQAGPGGRQGMGRMGGGTNPVLQLLAAGRLTAKAKGKLATVETTDGASIAVVDIQAVLTGKGSGEELGLPQGGAAFGGRGQSGRGGAQGTDAVEASLQLTGKARVDLTSHRIVSVELNGPVTLVRATSRTMDRDGEETRIDVHTDTKGSVRFAVRCEPTGN